MKILNLPDELQTQVYLPETIDECRKISCTDCICLSHRQEGCPCQFNVYLATHAARKTAEPDMLKGCIKGNAKPVTTRVEHESRASMFSNYKPPEQRLKEAEEEKAQEQATHSAQDILDMCMSLQAGALQTQVEPLQSMVNVLDLIIEVTEKQDKLTKIQQEQPAQEDQSNIPLWFMPSMENANDDVDGRDHYHHCSKKDNKLVRLIYVEEDKVYACPTCRRVFYLK